jgi:hypothetical protein
MQGDEASWVARCREAQFVQQFSAVGSDAHGTILGYSRHGGQDPVLGDSALKKQFIKAWEAA